MFSRRKIFISFREHTTIGCCGCIYLVCTLLNISISKKDISTSCKISEVTISKCYKKLLKYHNHLLPKNVLNRLYK